MFKNSFSCKVGFNGRSGATIVEILIVIFIAVAIAFITLPSLLGKRGQTDLNNTVQQMAALLREARSRSVSQSSSTSWGVRFENSTVTAPFFSMFYSQTYNDSTKTGYYKLPSTLAYATSSIASGSYKEITFSQLSGLASASTSITVYLVKGGPANSLTISVASSGAVSF